MNDQNEIGGDLQDEYLEIQEREECLAGAPWNQINILGEQDWLPLS